MFMNLAMDFVVTEPGLLQNIALIAIKIFTVNFLLCPMTGYMNFFNEILNILLKWENPCIMTQLEILLRKEFWITKISSLLMMLLCITFIRQNHILLLLTKFTRRN